MRLTLLLLILLILADSVSYAEETSAYEDGLTGRLAGIYVDGESVWIPLEDRPFLGLYRKSTSPGPTRVALILHSMGAHADWPDVISPLRTQLPGKGWSTLSIQLPVLAPQISLSDYGTSFRHSALRIRASIKYLQDQGHANIVLLGYSFGATTAIDYLAADAGGLRGFAGISMQDFPFLNPPFTLLEPLARINIPVLDIYGSRDYSDVLRSVDARRLAASKGGNRAYQQQMIEDSDHYFSGKQGELVDRIVEWLDTVVPGRLHRDADPFYLL